MVRSFETRRVVVLDTSALVAGFDPFSVGEELYTVPLVLEELRGNTVKWARVKTAIESKKIVVKKPDETFLEEVKNSATIMGDKFFLSEADLQVLALSLKLKSEGYMPVIASDDYSIQNVADHLGVKFVSLATFGIRYQLEWIRYCPACRKKYSADYRFRKCEVCDTELKRKPLRKKYIKRD